MRKFVLQLHLIVALAAGAFLVVLGLTGAIMAFEPEFDHMTHARVSYVTPSGPTKPLAELGAAASRVMSGQRPTGYALSASPDLSYQVLFRGRAVFVNQYIGEVLGVRAPGPDWLARVHQLHLRLLIQNQSDTGKTIMTWAGVAMLFLAVSGLYLWWPLKRFAIGTQGGSRRVWFDVHNTVGILSFVFLLVAGITGVAIGFDDAMRPSIYKATRSEPLLMYARPPSFTIAPLGEPIGPDRAVEIAREALPGASPVSVNVPAPTGVYAISARFPEDLTPGGRSRIYIEQYTGAVLIAEGSRTAPAGSKLITLNRAIHTGDVFGIPSKTIMSLASVAVVFQLVTGVMMWLKKRSSAAAAR
jgi:uncharacterized iron-regulated membrane protein